LINRRRGGVASLNPAGETSSVRDQVDDTNEGTTTVVIMKTVTTTLRAAEDAVAEGTFAWRSWRCWPNDQCTATK
jgi:hypothetical protein